MQDIPIDKLIDRTGSIYKLVVLASRRALELIGDAAKLVETSPDTKPGSIALKEIIEGKVTYKIKEKK